MPLISEPALPISEAAINPFITNREDSTMSDTSGPAYPFECTESDNPGKVLVYTGLSKRLYLMAHAPAPPESWIEGHLNRHRQTESVAIVQHAQDRGAAFKRGDPPPEPRQPTPTPTDLDLDIRWRLAWADRALELNSEE